MDAALGSGGREDVHIEDDLVFFHVSSPKHVSYVYRGLMAKDFGGVFTSRYVRTMLCVTLGRVRPLFLSLFAPHRAVLR